MIERMVVGYAFDKAFSNVLLIRKKRPDWQRNMLNGLGGHIESGETPLEAMRRECLEECGLDIQEWKTICFMSGENWDLEIFATQSDDIFNAQSKTDENVVIYNLFDLIYVDACVPNVKWLIPMCEEHIKNPHTFKQARFMY